MRAINHALTGAVIGLSVSEPALALPAAFLSHFVLDAIPHFGERKKDHGSKNFRDLLVLDALLCALLVLIIFIVHPRRWLQAAICAFLATSPDFMWVKKYLRARNNQKPRPNTNAIMRFHGDIQWFERPIGLAVELAWLTTAVIVLSALLRA